MIATILNAALYTAGWLICVISGARGDVWLPTLFTIISVFGQLAYWHRTDLNKYWRDLFLLVYATTIGLIMEMVFIGGGILHYATKSSLFYLFPPSWLLWLYPLFSLTLNHSLSWIGRSYVIAAVFGGVGGALSYLSGHYLGAVNFGDPLFFSLCVVALFWAIFMCVIVYLNRSLGTVVDLAVDNMRMAKQVCLLYDGDCPLCSREVAMLKERNRLGSVNFLDIANESYKMRDDVPVKYAEAMKEIHTVGSEGELLKGTDAFFEIYSRTGLTWLAIMLKAPLFSPLFKLGYKIFAKNRLRLTGRS